ncbi:hypothetical protein HPB47_010828 [Ixodes persulcatus]|uniref:Uncharacterized protein n=1 Tax=Ixodes persulcatus TaxID=34615 RepID=A0AC60NY70_IXOPE|nr:hypothetical protein HPB47_010828 [Ixodes persulcatus]
MGRRTGRFGAEISVPGRFGTWSFRNSGEEQSEIDVRALLASINQRLAGLPELKEKVDSMKRSVQFLSKQFDDLEKTIKVHDTEIKEQKRRVTDLEKKDELSRAVNDQLQKEVNDLEFRSRRLNLEVHGIPEVQGENLIETLNKVAEKLELFTGCPQDKSTPPE